MAHKIKPIEIIPLLDIPAVATMLNLPEHEVLEMIRRRELPAYRLGQGFRIDQDAVRRFLDARKTIGEDKRP